MSLPSALECFDELFARTDGRPLAVFVDFDGTLAPLVSRPQGAALPEEMRRILQELAGWLPVSIVSGRDLRDVQQMVGLGGIFYAGSHGFEVVGPGGARIDDGAGDAFLPALGDAERELRTALARVPDVLVERKRFAIAVHYRQLPETELPSLEAIVNRVAAQCPLLRRIEGKKVLELLPDIARDKGTAVRRVIEVLDDGTVRPLPLYIGDDLTDEDAFRAIRDDGIPIVVRDAPRPTFARYALDGPSDVGRFLRAVCGRRGCGVCPSGEARREPGDHSGLHEPDHESCDHPRHRT